MAKSRRKPPRGRRKKISPEQQAENDLIARAQAGDRAALTQLTSKYDRMLWKFAIHAAKTEDEKDDFRQIGFIYFLQAVESFDPQFGANFLTHCCNRIPLQLLRNRADYSNLIHIPAYVHLSGDRHPRALSADAVFIGEDDSDTNSDSWLSSSDIDPLAGMISREESGMLQAAISALPEHEAEIIRSRLRGEILEVIGDRIGLTKERVRQIEKNARKHLRGLMGMEPAPRFAFTSACDPRSKKAAKMTGREYRPRGKN